MGVYEFVGTPTSRRLGTPTSRRPGSADVSSAWRRESQRKCRNVVTLSLHSCAGRRDVGAPGSRRRTPPRGQRQAAAPSSCHHDPTRTCVFRARPARTACACPEDHHRSSQPTPTRHGGAAFPNPGSPRLRLSARSKAYSSSSRFEPKR